MSDSIIETARLVLCKIRSDDATGLTSMLSNPVVMKWLFGLGPMTDDEARRFIEEYFTFGRSLSGLGVLRVKSSDEFVGFAGLLPCRYLYEDDYEIGFALTQEHWGKGYATEIGTAQIAYGFDTFKVRRLLGLAHPQNTASLKTLEKIGMKPIKLINTDKRGPRCVYAIRRP
ncbi:MAG TPA: GNAT family N-acetyltransferase [Syntrophorhabdaceae bacterium]|nr:GNAT family N-acetyltransferase [Syntrophorhabdaceae bacterium]